MAGHTCMRLRGPASRARRSIRQRIPYLIPRTGSGVPTQDFPERLDRRTAPNHCSDSNSISYRTRQECSAYADHDFGGRDEVL